MSIRSKYIFSILAILITTTSVYVCLGISMDSMHGMDMGGVATTLEHMEHVQSLTLVIIPTLTLLAFSLYAIALVCGQATFDFSSVYLYALADSSPPKQKQRKRHFSHLRSPPFC